MKYKIKLLVGWALLTLFISLTYAAQDLRPFTKDSVKEITTAQAGTPFVLVIWSLDCPFCMTSLENLAAERRRGKKLRIVTVSTDSFSDAEAMAAARKKLFDLRLIENAWAYGSEPQEYLRYTLDPKWHGEKPRTYWYNARGERRAYSGLITPKLIQDFSAGF